MPRILVVDDEESVRQLLQTILKLEGFEVTTARDGNEALRATETASFDAVLLDLMMPNLNGEDTLRALRARDRTMDVPVIVITAKEGEASVLETTIAGADAYLSKPFEPETVVSLLKRLVP